MADPRNRTDHKMNKRNSLISLMVLLVCGAILVLFTDVELSLVRWINCGPWAAQADRQSEICRQRR